jgi:hypothetical protein
VEQKTLGTEPFLSIKRISRRLESFVFIHTTEVAQVQSHHTGKMHFEINIPYQLFLLYSHLDAFSVQLSTPLVTNQVKRQF